MNPRAASSRKIVERAVWSAVRSEAESRAYLQERIALLFKLMFWSLIVLMIFLAGMYATYERETAPEQRTLVYLTASIGFAAMAFCWRVLLTRRRLSIEALYRIDLAYSLGIGATFAVSAYLQWDLRASGYLSVIYSTFTVFARALIVPSSARRTLATSLLTFIPLTFAALALALTRTEDFPGPAFVLGYLLFSTAPILLATLGSQILYGLREKFSAAQQLGQYTLDRKIGEGGNGAVYLAHHILLRRPTAVKLVLPGRVAADTLRRFEREVQNMSKLAHPNSVAVYDYGRSPDGTFYYAMEYLGGGIDLDKLVRTNGAQPSGRVARILAQVCGALHEAHQNNLVHRDIKPANIILCERGGVPDVAKVVDYGLVKEITADTGARTAQVVLGTPAYLAPEAITDPGTIGPAVDIYAVGAVGYFLVTGRPVFSGKTSLDICVQHVTKAVTPPSQVTQEPIDEALEKIILRCLAKSREERFASAQALREALIAVPANDWDDGRARAWWSDYKKLEDRLRQVSELPTQSITVDLGDRIPMA